jgi:hypothetical protein
VWHTYAQQPRTSRIRSKSGIHAVGTARSMGKEGGHLRYRGAEQLSLSACPHVPSQQHFCYEAMELGPATVAAAAATLRMYINIS